MGEHAAISSLLVQSEFRKNTARLLQHETFIHLPVFARRYFPQFSSIRQHVGVSFSTPKRKSRISRDKHVRSLFAQIQHYETLGTASIHHPE